VATSCQPAVQGIHVGDEGGGGCSRAQAPHPSLYFGINAGIKQRILGHLILGYHPIYAGAMGSIVVLVKQAGIVLQERQSGVQAIGIVLQERQSGVQASTIGTQASGLGSRV